MELVTEQVAKRTLIENTIEAYPGIRYRELLRISGLANGVLSYHLAALEKSDRIRADRKSRITRYYPPSVSERESSVINHIRHEPVRNILLFTYENENCTFNEIMEHAQRAASTVSSHLKRLRHDGIISVRYGELQLYRVSDRELVSHVLSVYRPSFIDKVVDSYIGAVEEL